MGNCCQNVITVRETVKSLLPRPNDKNKLIEETILRFLNIQKLPQQS